MALVAERDEVWCAAHAEKARRAMIDSQLRVSGVNDESVLAAMAGVPREDFVPETLRRMAYVDRALPLGEGRYIAAPLVHGMMLEQAAPMPDDRILVVDGGSGYLTALLRFMSASAETIEPAAALDSNCKQGSCTLLLIDGAVEQFPAALANRLVEGGRVVTGLIEKGVTRLATGRKVAGVVSFLPLAESGIPVLPEFAAPKRWQF